MRNMRSSLPVFIFIGLALVAIIGVIILETSATSAGIAVNNTSTDTLSTGMYETEYNIVLGVSGLLLLVAGYFALKLLT